MMLTIEKIRLAGWRLMPTLAAAALCAGCFQSQPAVGADETAPAPAEEIVATVGESGITRAELEREIAPQLLKLAQQRQQLLEQGLEQAVSQKLLELEAAARGISAEELERSEIDDRVEAPTDADVDAFYEQNKARLNQPKEQLADRIRQFLTERSQQGRRGEYLQLLRARYGVEVRLDPLRVPVAAEGFPARGPADAPVTLVEFSDFECPYCSRVVPTLEKVKEVYGDRVRVVFRQFPLQMHANAQKAAEASLCAHEQGRFWEMHDAMFAAQRELGVDQLKEKATTIGLDAEAFNACLDSGRHADSVRADLEAGTSAGVDGTPALFINGRFLAGAQPFETIAKVIDEELERAGP